LVPCFGCLLEIEAIKNLIRFVDALAGRRLSLDVATQTTATQKVAGANDQTELSRMEKTQKLTDFEELSNMGIGKPLLIDVVILMRRTTKITEDAESASAPDGESRMDKVL
jgi:hypothetical protein